MMGMDVEDRSDAREDGPAHLVCADRGCWICPFCLDL